MAHVINEQIKSVDLVSEIKKAMREIEKRDIHRNYFTLTEIEEYLTKKGIHYSVLVELGQAITELCRLGIIDMAFEKPNKNYVVKLMNNKKL